MRNIKARVCEQRNGRDTSDRGWSAGHTRVCTPESIGWGSETSGSGTDAADQRHVNSPPKYSTASKTSLPGAVEGRMKRDVTGKTPPQMTSELILH